MVSRPATSGATIGFAVAAALICSLTSATAQAHPQPRSHLRHGGGAHRTQVGKASYYGSHSAGKKTASGAPFNPNHLTAASKTLPLGTTAQVTNTKTGQSTQVTVTDRGPVAKGRILDVSPKAADQLGLKTAGVSTVKVKPISEPPKPGLAHP